MTANTETTLSPNANRSSQLIPQFRRVKTSARRIRAGKNKRGQREEKRAGKQEPAGKLPRAFCYSDEKFRHADWMIMSLEKCENEPACRSTSRKV